MDRIREAAEDDSLNTQISNSTAKREDKNKCSTISKVMMSRKINKKEKKSKSKSSKFDIDKDIDETEVQKVSQTDKKKLKKKKKFNLF